MVAGLNHFTQLFEVETITQLSCLPRNAGQLVNVLGFNLLSASIGIKA